MTNNLYKPIRVGSVSLQHRVVLAPLARFRADGDHSPNALMTEYYTQRASVPGTLLITEATFPSAQCGFQPNSPGVWSEKHIRRWKDIADSVHAKGSHMFMQIFALGRYSSKKMLKEWGFDYTAPSAIAPMEPNPFTNEHEIPRALTRAEIKQLVADFVQGAKNAMAAGMDGVEIHGAHGYLINQFLDQDANHRTDEYGGSIENKCRFILELVDAIGEEIGFDRVAVRMSPWLHKKMCNYDISPIPIFSYIATELERRARQGKRIAYIHIIEPRVAADVDAESYIGSNDWFRYIWSGNIIRAGGFQKELAEEYASNDDKTLFAFGRRYIPNPDLPVRLERDIKLTPYYRPTFYSGGIEGYTTYKPAKL